MNFVSCPVLAANTSREVSGTGGGPPLWSPSDSAIATGVGKIFSADDGSSKQTMILLQSFNEFDIQDFVDVLTSSVRIQYLFHGQYRKREFCTLEQSDFQSNTEHSSGG